MGRKARSGAYDAASVGVGKRIRTLRHARGLTLKTLGSECGLSHPFLSQVERGVARPSLETLTAIAEALGTSVAGLTSREQRQTVSFTTREGARTVQIDRPDAWPTLIRQKIEEAELLHAIEATFEGGAEFDETVAYPGEKFIYVISGLFEVEIDGDEYVLEPGDSVTFDADTAHVYRCRRAGRILVVASSNELIQELAIADQVEQRAAVQDQPIATVGSNPNTSTRRRDISDPPPIPVIPTSRPMSSPANESSPSTTPDATHGHESAAVE